GRGTGRWRYRFCFFQAEDGIRDFHVTGVQTCALPISRAVQARGGVATGRRPRAWTARVRENGGMSGLSDTLAALARGGGQLLRVPTALLLGWAGLVLLVLALEVWALLAPAGGPGPVGSALLVALVALLAVPVVVLAVRRRRWLRLTRQASAEAASATVVVGGSTDLVTIDALGDRVEDEISGMDGEE